MQHPPHRWVPRILLAALLALGLAACGDAPDPTAPDAARTVVLSSKGAAPPDTTALPPTEPEACSWVLIRVIQNADGTRTYVYEEQCSSGGGGDGGGDGGGSGGGGGDTCDPTMVIGGWYDYGGGGVTCDMKRDHNCLQLLTDADHQVLAEAWKKIKTQFADPATQQICFQLRDRYANPYSAGNVYRGSANSYYHDAQTYRGKVHIDPKYLDLAAQNMDAGGGGYYEVLAQLVLHEAAHDIPYANHVGETQSPYYTHPYNHLRPETGVEQCV